MDRLSDEALRAANFSWEAPVPPEEGRRDEEELDEEAELLLDRVEEDMADEYSEEEEEDILHIDDLANFALKV